MQIEKSLIPVSICLINYNGEKYLPETLSSLIPQKNKCTEIIVIDNASEDNSVNFIKAHYPDIRVVQLDSNYGPAAARNTAFKIASSDIILFIDNDVSLSNDFCSNLLCELEDNNYPAVIMPQVIFASQSDRVQYNGASCHFLGHMIPEGENDRPVISVKFSRKNDSVITACFIVNRKKLQAIEPFDESFFFNYEDHDFGLRTRLKGLDIISLSTLHCYHREGTAGLSRREGWRYSKLRAYYLIRNRWQIILKNYSLRTIFLLFPFFVIYELFQLAAVIKKHWFAEWIKAILWILANLHHIIIKRRAVQRTRKIPDSDILRGGPLPFFKDLPQSRPESVAKNLLDNLAELYWKKVKAFI